MLILIFFIIILLEIMTLSFTLIKIKEYYII